MGLSALHSSISLSAIPCWPTSLVVISVLLSASHYAISSGLVTFSASDVLLCASHYAISSGLVSFSASRQQVTDCRVSAIASESETLVSPLYLSSRSPLHAVISSSQVDYRWGGGRGGEPPPVVWSDGWPTLTAIDMAPPICQ